MMGVAANLRTDPELLARLIESARNHVMSPAERRAQRRSWVLGEFMLAHPDVSREKAEALVDRVLSELTP